ncbi:hypothetical protein J6590_004607 [Homalodisca vitripennis]|nr:hypothetical protein J6590_004607 [Homalodisca vitripennis]
MDLPDSEAPTWYNLKKAMYYSMLLMYVSHEENVRVASQNISHVIILMEEHEDNYSDSSTKPNKKVEMKAVKTAKQNLQKAENRIKHISGRNFNLKIAFDLVPGLCSTKRVTSKLDYTTRHHKYGDCDFPRGAIALRVATLGTINAATKSSTAPMIYALVYE